MKFSPYVVLGRHGINKKYMFFELVTDYREGKKGLTPTSFKLAISSSS